VSWAAVSTDSRNTVNSATAGRERIPKFYTGIRDAGARRLPSHGV
jgi:hypothetical protein